MPSLHALEAWMQTVITHPNGVLAGADSSEAIRHLAATSADVDRVVCATPTWSAADRLRVYSNAYLSRLEECLRDEFPIVRETVGDEVFDSFVFEYLQKYPPGSYTLGKLGGQFPRFLAATRPPREHNDSGADWADFLADLADFEWTISQVFDGPGTESMPCDGTPEFSGLSSHQLMNATAVVAPCLSLRTYRFPVPAYHVAIKAGRTAEMPAAVPSYVAMTRRNFTVKHRTLEASEFALLTALNSEKTLGEALDAVCGNDETVWTEVGANIARWFAEWTQLGLLLRMEIPRD